MPRPVQDIEDDLALAQERVLQYEQELSARVSTTLNVTTRYGKPTRLSVFDVNELALRLDGRPDVLYTSAVVAEIRDWLNYHYPQEASC